MRPQYPIKRTHLRQRETESYNVLNCSNGNKVIFGKGLFCHNKWVAKRQGHRNLEFRIVHLLKPAPQTQTATAHLQTTWTVYIDGQGTHVLPCGKIPGGEERGGMGWATLRASLSGTFLQTLPDLVTPLKGHSESPRSCPPTRSAPSERFGY